jgi:beta-glucosidase
VAVLTPIDSSTTQLIANMSQQNEIDLMSNDPSCTDYTDPKCPFHSQGTTVGSTTIGYYEMRDGPRGVRGTEWNQQSTTWAVAEARAASFDTTLEYNVGLAQGQEMKALGNDLALAPVVNTLRNPLWARAQETYGEDPVLLGEMGAAFANGMQQTVATCVKHFVGNDTDNNRMTANAVENEQTLRENYTRPFEIVVKKADPACVMAAYNEVNGIHCTENTHLLTDILRTDWGWTGFVVSDWGASVAGDGAKSVTAGLDLEMPFRSNSFDVLPTGVTAAQIQQSATRIVNARAKFNDFAGNAAGTLNPGIVTDATHISVARQTEEEGAVLLKNNGVLPFGSSVKSIAIVGPDYQRPIAPTAAENGSAAKDANPFVSGLGDRGSSQTVPPHAVSYLSGITTRAGSGITVTSSADASAGANANVIVVPVTMAHEDEGEAYGGGADRVDLTLTDVHPIHWGTPKPTAFINTLRTTYPNAKIVVLLAVGSAIVMEDWMNSADAIVQTFYPGQEGGTAVAELVFGDINFSGKLPFTVSADPTGSDYPAFQNASSQANIDYLHGYRRFEANGVTPRFWFGFGLSYTTYAYSNLQVLCSHISTTGRLNVQVTVKNTGSVAGTEIVQLYIGYPNKLTSQPRPPKELKAFTRVTLAAGASQNVQLSVPATDMAYWDMGSNGWVVEKAVTTVYVGSSSNPKDPNLLSAPFTIE